jgi:hypothetical protein
MHEVGTDTLGLGSFAYLRVASEFIDLIFDVCVNGRGVELFQKRYHFLLDSSAVWLNDGLKGYMELLKGLLN